MANIGLTTALSNVVSVISILVIAKMPLSTYTVANSALSIIGAALLSRFYFKENITIKQYASVILAVIALIPGAL